MPRGLERRYGFGHHHFVTVSCFHRQPHFAELRARQVFEASLEAMRQKYGFSVDSYVVMPEHVHLLVSEPKEKTLSVVLQALKISVSRRLLPRPFWQKRFYDFNVYTERKHLEKRRCIHRNPCVRQLVNHPKDWPWSSYRHWAYGQDGTVQLESTWTYERRMQAMLQSGLLSPSSCKPTSENPDVGHPLAKDDR